MSDCDKSKHLKVAVTQAEPEWLDLAGSVNKTCSLINEATENGARLVAFPECWILGYPGWIWQRPVDPYIENSLKVDSDEMRTIQACAKSNSIAISLGFSGRTESNSLYIYQVIINPEGEIATGLLFQEPGGGHSAVYGPDGRRLTKPLANGDATAEGIVYTELDLRVIVTNRSFLDVVGHCSRPDLLWLGVDKKQKDIVVSTDKHEGA
ncbi:unnamed protein product [Fusarium venenatum]|uniref:nitrilase n=1 Tax=Fusarium venenatum TaxID=56646 RepID=A0A2L2TQR2_9HYPO|nr:uncharacterized protein FVRRES_08378 [Fusarium venenatum]CEI68301.1 unnamed protein product [Fusarium venenatum]